MSEPAAVIDQIEYDLDIFGQQPGLSGLYTQICFCFPMPDASLHPPIIRTLTKGLERLSASFPWLAGQVINEGSHEGNSGVYKIIPLSRIPPLIEKDYIQDPSFPSMSTLQHARFPFSMLDESTICPRLTLPTGETPQPVFLLQANFVTGGLLLTFTAHHQTMDMTGQGHIIYLFSKACRNERFTSEELSTGNLPRRDIIPLLDASYIPGAELAHQVIKKATPSHATPEGTTIDPPAPPPKCSWKYFNFAPTSLAALKALATSTLPHSIPYISTDDALSAFIWQRITLARLPRLPKEPNAYSKFARAVSVRSHLSIPQSCPGLVQNMAYHTYSLQQLPEAPLGELAGELRSAVHPTTSTLAQDTRALATYLSRVADKSGTSITATLDLNKDIMLSSWAQVKAYEIDFGLGLGRPEAVRRPKFTPVESLIYLMPKTLEGDIPVGVCLREEDEGRLKGDEEFVRYATYIG